MSLLKFTQLSYRSPSLTFTTNSVLWRRTLLATTSISRRSFAITTRSPVKKLGNRIPYNVVPFHTQIRCYSTVESNEIGGFSHAFDHGIEVGLRLTEETKKKFLMKKEETVCTIYIKTKGSAGKELAETIVQNLLSKSEPEAKPTPESSRPFFKLQQSAGSIMEKAVNSLSKDRPIDHRN